MRDSVCAEKNKKATWKIPGCVQESLEGTKGQGKVAAGESLKTSGLGAGIANKKSNEKGGWAQGALGVWCLFNTEVGMEVFLANADSWIALNSSQSESARLCQVLQEFLPRAFSSALLLSQAVLRAQIRPVGHRGTMFQLSRVIFAYRQKLPYLKCMPLPFLQVFSLHLFFTLGMNFHSCFCSVSPLPRLDLSSLFSPFPHLFPLTSFLVIHACQHLTAVQIRSCWSQADSLLLRGGNLSAKSDA